MKRVFVWFLCVVLFAAILSDDAYALRSNSTRAPESPRLLRALKELGTGNDALIAVRLRDKSVVSGWVTEAGPDSFVVVQTKNDDQQRTVRYADVSKLVGYNLASGVEVQHGAGVRAKLARAIAHLVPGHRIAANSLTGGERTLLIGIVVGILIAILLAKVL